MSDLTVNNLTVLENVVFTPASGHQGALVCAGADLEISSEKQVRFTPQNGVRISSTTSPALTVEGNVVAGKYLKFGELTLTSTVKTASSSTNDGYGGTPSSPGPLAPSVLLGAVGNNSLAIEIDSVTHNLVLTWQTNGQKYKHILTGTKV